MWDSDNSLDGELTYFQGIHTQYPLRAFTYLIIIYTKRNIKRLLN